MTCQLPQRFQCEDGETEKFNQYNEDLGLTSRFKVHQNSAQFYPDGSLKYGHNLKPLPLTPIQKKYNGKQEVPPLDLTGLRGSADSTNSYKPYTGTSRSFDSYRFSGDQRPLSPLKTLPESSNLSL